MNTNDEDTDADEKAFAKTRIGAKQREWLKAELANNTQVRWTFIFLHHPLWNFKEIENNGWLPVEDLLENRQYTVFAGHVHVFRKSIRKGRNLYQLATTGGGSSMRGSEYGEIDQVAWVTMKGKEPVISQIGLHGVYSDWTTVSAAVVAWHHLKILPQSLVHHSAEGTEDGLHLRPKREP